jgi:predicted MFS family arabinose efflux permease
LTNTGLTLGSAATGPLIAWLMGTLGWRQSFVLTAPLAFLLAGVWWWYGRDYPVETPSPARWSDRACRRRGPQLWEKA